MQSLAMFFRFFLKLKSCKLSIVNLAMNNKCCCVFSLDGNYLATSLFENIVKIWDLRNNNTLIKTLDHHSDIVTTIAFTPEGLYLATASKDKKIVIVNTITWSTEYIFENDTEINCIAFSPNGRELAIASQNRDIILQTYFTFPLFKKFIGHTNFVNTIAFSVDGKFLLSGGVDKTVRLWDTNTGKQLKRYRDHCCQVTHVCFSECGRYFASLGEHINVFSTQNLQKINVIQPTCTNQSYFDIYTMAFSADGRDIILGTRRNGRHDIFTMKTKQNIRDFHFIANIQSHTNKISKIDVSFDGRKCVSASLEQIFLWNTSNWTHEQLYYIPQIPQIPQISPNPQIPEESNTEKVERNYTNVLTPDSSCVICLELLIAKNGIQQELPILPCNHCFHKDCINEWLEQKQYCPICKSKKMNS